MKKAEISDIIQKQISSRSWKVSRREKREREEQEEKERKKQEKQNKKK